MSNTTNCGCCAGTATDTPAVKFNRPGLPAIAYRVGRHADFKATLLARLSALHFPPLKTLTTRRDDDYTIALCDAFATLADVLTFYQERIANEAYLRTATERRSVLELARLIGYQLAPGVAASTALAFTLEQAPGAPALAAQPVTIPIGTRVQSVPDPEQAPQNFETVTAITARVEWNAIPAQLSEAVTIAQGLTEIYLAGTTTQLQLGDAILLVGLERETDASSTRWDVRWIERVDVDGVRNFTRVAWSTGLGSQWSPPSGEGVRVYVLRQRAALFGNNAPDPNLLRNKNNKKLFGGGKPPNTTWLGYEATAGSAQIDLDAVYPKVVHDSWIVLADASDPSLLINSAQLHRVNAVTQLSQAKFGLTGKVTRIKIDPVLTEKYDLQKTQVLVQSEELTFARRPLAYPVFGSTLLLDRIEPDLAPGQLVAFSGKRQHVAIGLDPSGVSFVDDPTRIGQPGEAFVLLAAPEQLLSGEYQAVDPPALDPLNPLSGTMRWKLEDRNGETLMVNAPAAAFSLQPALKDDAVISEIGEIAVGAVGVTSDLERTKVTLQLPLAGCYDRATFVVNANVAPATHGEAVGEIAGSGDASRPNQTFTLKQSPLTYVSTSKLNGRDATLQARVNDLLWKEVPSLYGRGPLDRVYTLRQSDDGKTTIQFGDGVQGSRLPSGQNNLRLGYRKGLGVGGNLRTGQLTTLLTRPLGVKTVNNPSPSTGGQDPEQLADARQNAPLHVLTLDRAVSIDDYADFSRTFSGVAKACAAWINDGQARGVYLTVAGPKGAAIPAGSDTLKDLIDALRRYGDPLLPLSVQSYSPATFLMQATIKVSDDADTDKVLAAVKDALRAAYAFDARDFGQPVSIDAVYATIQNVAGVVAANISMFYRSDAQKPSLELRLLAALPAVQADGSVGAAEILTLDPAPLDLGAMP